MALHAQGLAAFTSKSESYWKHESINKYDTTNYGTREFLLACVAQIKKKEKSIFQLVQRRQNTYPPRRLTDLLKD
jgi:hypothetical protein